MIYPLAPTLMEQPVYNPATAHLCGINSTYGSVSLSTNAPNPSRKSVVMAPICCTVIK